MSTYPQQHHEFPFTIKHIAHSLLTAFSPNILGCILLISLGVISTSVVANQTDEATSTIEKISISGERADKTRLETASSVNVFTVDDLNDFAGPDTLATLFNKTPNVSLTGEGNQGPTIRGANTSGVLTSLASFFGGSQARTTIQVDGRQLTFNEFVYGGESAWDIKQVEIFRGPQTTTQGRNAIAGAVFIQTNNPNHNQTEGKLRFIAGRFNTQQISSVISAPIGNGDLAYRFSTDYRQSDSYIDVLGIPNDFNENVDMKEALNVRGKLSYQPENISALTAQLTITHSDTRRPQTDSIDAPFSSLQRTNPGFSIFDNKASSVVTKFSYELSPQFTLNNVLTYTDISSERIAPIGQGNATIDHDEITNELLLSYQGSWIQRALFGAYASAVESDERLNLDAFALGVGDFTDARNSYGFFAQTDIVLSDAWILTTGARWQRDSQDREGGFGNIIPIDFDDHFDDFLPKAELTYVINSNQRTGISIEKGFNAGGFTFNFDTFSTETFDEESLVNYEVFYRGVLANGRLNINANLFHSKFNNMQIATLVNLGENFFANVFSNVKHAQSNGFETDINYQIVDNLRINLGLGITNTEILSDSNAGALTKGNDFQRAPNLTAIAGIVYEPITHVSLSAFARYSDSYFSDDANIVANRADHSTILDVQASYQWPHVRAFLDITNALNKFYTVSVFDTGSLASVGEPRNLSIGVEWQF